MQNWFRRLVAHASQAPLLQEALDELTFYTHPWQNRADLRAWGKAQFGEDWEFDPLVHHTTEILRQVHAQDPALAATLKLAWAGDATTSYSSYRNRARELARICGESLDHKPGSADMQIIENAEPNNGFQILDMMKKATILHTPIDASNDFVDQDKELKRIRHKFVKDGVKTYVAAYRRQLQLFIEMKLPFQLPEEYNCQRMIAHLSTRCMEFKHCAKEFGDAVRDKKIKYSYPNVIARFSRCEKRHALGASNRGTHFTWTHKVLTHLQNFTKQKC